MTSPDGAVSASTLPRRWLLLGPGGAGKSTLARRMSDALGLPLIHLDRHYWRPGWVESSREAFDARVAELAAGEAWIMDGNYGRTLHLRVPRAQGAVLLDPPPLQCLWGVISRSLTRSGRSRSDLAEGCPEQFPELQFLHYIAMYRRVSRPKVLRHIEASPHLRFHHLRSRGEGQALVEALAREWAASR